MVAARLLPPSELIKPSLTSRWLAVCLAEYDFLRELDGELIPVGDVEQAVIDRAKMLRAEWGRWAEDAAELLERTQSDPSLTDEDRQSLQHKVWHGKGISKADVDVLRQRYEQVQRGEYITREEARRELGLPHRR